MDVLHVPSQHDQSQQSHCPSSAHLQTLYSSARRKELLPTERRAVTCRSSLMSRQGCQLLLLAMHWSLAAPLGSAALARASLAATLESNLGSRRHKSTLNCFLSSPCDAEIWLYQSLEKDRSSDAVSLLCVQASSLHCPRDSPGLKSRPRCLFMQNRHRGKRFTSLTLSHLPSPGGCECCLLTELQCICTEELRLSSDEYRTHISFQAGGWRDSFNFKTLSGSIYSIFQYFTRSTWPKASTLLGGEKNQTSSKHGRSKSIYRQLDGKESK